MPELAPCYLQFFISVFACWSHPWADLSRIWYTQRRRTARLHWARFVNRPPIRLRNASFYCQFHLFDISWFNDSSLSTSPSFRYIFFSDRLLPFRHGGKKEGCFQFLIELNHGFQDVMRVIGIQVCRGFIASTREGFLTMARAIATRWHSPRKAAGVFVSPYR